MPEGCTREFDLASGGEPVAPGRASGLTLEARSPALPAVPGVGAALPPYTDEVAEDEPDSTCTSASRFCRLAVKLPGPSSPPV